MNARGLGIGSFHESMMSEVTNSQSDIFLLLQEQKQCLSAPSSSCFSDVPVGLKSTAFKLHQFD